MLLASDPNQGPLRRLPGAGDLRLVAAGTRTSDAGWSTDRDPPYRSLATSMIVVHHGTASVEIDGRWNDLGAGVVNLVPPHRWLRRRTTGFRHTFAIVACTDGVIDIHLGRVGDIVQVPLDDSWRSGLAAAARWTPGTIPPVVDCIRLEALLLQVVAHLLEAAGPMPRAGHDDLVARACAWLDDHALERPAIAALARAVGCSPNHLHTRFAATMGITPAAYAEQRRLREAERMLLTTDLPVQTVAGRCGYTDPFHFSRVVRRHFGLGPRDLRRRD